MSSRTSIVIGFLVLLVFDTLAQVCFKLTAISAAPLTFDLPWFIRAITTPWLYGTILGYIGAFIAWMALLRYIPIGPATAASHIEVVGVMIVSVPLFGEVLTLVQYLGAALIIAGVAFLAYGESILMPKGVMKKEGS